MISIIATYNNDKVIGSGGEIPWHCPKDTKRFNDITMGSPVVMGRKTWEYIGKILSERKNIVVTSDTNNYPRDVDVAPSFRSAIIGANEAYCADEIFIIGGEEIYRQAIDIADTMYLTHVYDNSPGDAYFPSFNPEEWEVKIAQQFSDHVFRILERKK